jgi:hypothetical protein
MPLNLFPPEICSQIYALACTDDGYTGRSLAAVSRYIHETSSPYKFQSIALPNAYRASLFASILGKTPPHLRGVAYLFVANDDFDIDGPGSRDSGTKTTSSRRSITSMFSSFVGSSAKLPPQTVNPMKDHDTDIIEAVLKILRLIAPTLRTLSISFECRWINSTSLFSVETSFPALSSLTELNLNYRAPTDALFNHFVFHFPASFPSLRRLDISGLKLLSYRFELFACITKIAPSLTHLRLPAKMALMNVPFVSPTTWPPTYRRSDDDNLPATLGRVLIQLNGPHGYTCPGQRLYQTGCTRCRLLAMATTDRKFVALEAQSDDTWQKNRERLENDWKDRIGGGEGSWNEESAVYE